MANGIKIGNLDISAFKVGSSDCKVYLGDTLLYPTAPPSFQGKWLATYSDSSTTSAECDSSSSITNNEIAKSNLVSVEIGDCVTSIGTSAFHNCRSITSIEIPSGVTSIGDDAFYGCSGLTSIDIPSGITYIGQYAFRDCKKLESIVIPNGVTAINTNTFKNCSGLTSCTIGSGVTIIDESAFASCTSLTSIDIPSGVTSIGKQAFERCSGLTSIEIPSGVTSIGQYAFRNCTGLTAITVNATTPPTLGSGAFDGSTCNIYVPAASLSAYQSAWSQYASRIVAMPTPTPTGSTCYEVISTPITSYTSTTYDSVYSFTDTKWYMKNNLSQYEQYGIYDIVNDIASATTYEGKLGVVGTTEYQYSGGSWSIVGSYVESSVTYTIDETSPSPYVGQELATTFKIPYADVEPIGAVSFTIYDNNDGGIEITLDTEGMTEYLYYTPSEEYYGEVTEDGEYFYLSLPSEAPQSIVIDSINYWKPEPIHLIAGSKQVTVEYEEKDMPLTDVYNTVADMEAVGCPTVGVGQYGVVGNDAYQFDGEDWNSASNYKLMEKNADGEANVLACNSSTDLLKAETQPSYFGNSSGITYAEIGDCVTNIGDWVFSGCTSLSSVTIPDNVTSIGNEAFMYCSSLTSIDIPSGVTSIGAYAFYGCTSLTSIVIPNSVISLGYCAFINCTSLTSCTIGSGVTSIDSQVFQGCSSLSSIDIPSGVTSIGNSVFASCSGLTSITVNRTTPPTLANANAFTNTNNCPIYVPSGSVEAYKSATNWSNYASRIQAIPSPTPTYTWTTIDDTFTNQQTPIPVYEINIDWLTIDDNNESFGFYDNPSFSGGYHCSIDYDENSGLYELLIYEYPNWTTAYTHSFTSSTDINIDFIDIFGKPMYFNSPPQEMGNCLNEECVGYDCLDWGCVDWDPDTGECIREDCIQQGDCNNWMCMEYETLYIVTAKIIQQN